MEGFRKPFSKTDNAMFDAPARDACKKFFPESSGIKVVDHKSTYAMDLCLNNSDGLIRYIETETKADPRWNSPKFPFSDLNFLGRKVEHLLNRDLDYSEKGLWVLWNYNYTQHAVVTLKEVLQVYNDRVTKFGKGNALVAWNNRVQRDQQGNAKKPEYFLKLPLDMVHWGGLASVLKRYGK